MALIIEDGSVVEGANSYNTTDQLVTYAGLRGTDLSESTESELEVMLINAMDYLEDKRDMFKGFKKDKDQPLQWPRYDVWIDNYSISSDSIPRELQYAQLSLAVEAKTVDLMPNALAGEKGAIVKERIEDAVEIAYSDKGAPRKIHAFAKANALINPLLKHGGMGLVSIRT